MTEGRGAKEGKSGELSKRGGILGRESRPKTQRQGVKRVNKGLSGGGGIIVE